MTVAFQRIITALLLASYGLTSACGGGLHALVDGSHDGAAKSCSTEGDHPAPASPASDHSDCLICHVVAQGQLLDLPEPISSESVAIGAVIPTIPIDLRSPDRLSSDPRAPPISLA
ncbi:DUF2946 family protein [Tautonia marina]|uniref:DUF2946 family protein n=1 Tax=Tautonia marina TaxID=2653855 RepID=UPI0012611CA2|nr:DUF2946 family protein [Tautonia marina]